MSQKNLNTFACSHSIQVGNEIFPCGKCIACRKKRITEWSDRMLCEFSTQQNKGLFITLTYRDKYLPTDNTLKKSDIQRFMKRWRRNIELNSGYYGTNFKIRVVYSGEYGKKNTLRPHYHIIAYGLEDTMQVRQDIVKAWSYVKREVYYVNAGTYKRNTKYHKKGDTKYEKVVVKYRDYIGDPAKALCIEQLEPRHFVYTAKYSVKTLSEERNGVREFFGMSRRKAIGSDYLEENKDKIFDNKGVIKIGKREFRAPALFKRKYKEECKAHTKVIYNIVTKKSMSLQDAWKFIIFNIMSIKDEVRRERELSEFLARKHEFNFITPKELLKIHDRNIQKEKSYMFKRKMSYHQFYRKNKKYFEPKLVESKKDYYDSNDNCVVHIGDKVWKNNYFIDFLNLYRYYDIIGTLFYRTYEYF